MKRFILVSSIVSFTYLYLRWLRVITADVIPEEVLFYTDLLVAYFILTALAVIAGRVVRIAVYSTLLLPFFIIGVVVAGIYILFVKTPLMVVGLGAITTTTVTMLTWLIVIPLLILKTIFYKIRYWRRYRRAIKQIRNYKPPRKEK